MSASQPDSLRDLEHLGAGGERDRLSLRVIVGILWRCLSLLRPVRGHITALVSAFSLMAIAFLPIALILIDTIWTRVLDGQALTPEEAEFFGLASAEWVQVQALDPAQRSALARRVVWASGFATAIIMPIVIALYYYQVWILQRVNQVLRVDLLDRLQSLSLRFHADSRVGDALYRLYQDSAMVTQLIDVLILTPMGSAGRFAFAVLVVAFLDPRLALVLALVWPPTLALGAWFSQRMRRRFRDARETNSRLTSRIQETVAGIKVIKAYGAEGFEQNRFEESSRNAFAAAFRARNLFAVFQVLIFWVLGTAILGATAWAALATRDGASVFAAAAGFSAWNLGLFNFFKWQAGSSGDSVRDLYRMWGRVQDVAIGLDRVFEILDLEPEVADAPDAVPFETLEQSIRFENVSFAYEPGRPVLEGASLEAQVGTITAIVGPTGSGKSTLMTLLLRLFDPSEGRITIDGRDLREFQTESLRKHVSIALQENILFGDTVRENIRYAVPDADDDAVRAAARVACADAFIQELPLGYDTPLGERGSKLSTGQRQRLSIARAILKDTPILILDEPTASLDAETELRVLDNLARWGEGRAIFLITHRLSTIARADQIAVVSNGHVAQLGAHQDLLREDGAYRSLVRSEVGAS